MKFKKVFLVMLALIGMDAYAAPEWVLASKSNENITYVDINSISQVREYAYTHYKKAWFKQVIYNDISKDGMTVGDYTMSLDWFDCSGDSSGTKQIVSYKKNGQIVPNSSRSRSYVNMTDVIPGTVGESMLQAVCD